MTDYAKRLAEIDARARAATKGPWPSEAGWNNGGTPSRTWKIPARQDGAEVEMLAEDALFVEHAREDVPWLLAQLRAASEALTAAGVDADGRPPAERIAETLGAIDAALAVNVSRTWRGQERSFVRRIEILTASESQFGREAFEAHTTLDPIVARQDATDGPLLTLPVRVATAVRIATEATEKIADLEAALRGAEGAANAARYAGDYRRAWEQQRALRDVETITRATAQDGLDTLRRAARAAVISLGANVPEDAGPAALASMLRVGVEGALAALRAAKVLAADGTLGEAAEDILRCADMLRRMRDGVTVEHRCADPTTCLLCTPPDVDADRLASEADRLGRRGLHEEAARLYGRAAAITERAVASAKGPRTRSLLMSNAVALWFKARRFKKAERLAHRYMAEGVSPALEQRLREIVLECRRHVPANDQCASGGCALCKAMDAADSPAPAKVRCRKCKYESTTGTKFPGDPCPNECGGVLRAAKRERVIELSEHEARHGGLHAPSGYTDAEMAERDDASRSRDARGAPLVGLTEEQRQHIADPESSPAFQRAMEREEDDAPEETNPAAHSPEAMWRDLAATAPADVAVDGTRLCRGMVLRHSGLDSNEAAIVLGPTQSRVLKGAWTVVHGYLDEPPTCGLAEVWPRNIPRVWRRASPQEAAAVRALFLAHAKKWGPDSKGWVALTIPADEQETPPPDAAVDEPAVGDGGLVQLTITTPDEWKKPLP